jgi:glycosyltransferase involved in cell wall biosynthesis
MSTGCENVTPSFTDSHKRRPLVSILLIAFNQQDVVQDAVRSVLAQSYSPLEILISDDCSTDATFDVIQRVVQDYHGEHTVILNRNPSNEGISGHLSTLASMSTGELLVVAAGDDIAMPDRCARLVDRWLEHDRVPDLIASDLVGIDWAGRQLGYIEPTRLDGYRSFDDWAGRRPFVVGAAHAWSRRLFEQFGGMERGAMAEDQIMVFRAIVSGGAVNLCEPLVRYRHGGLSAKRRYRSVEEFIERVKLMNGFALKEIEQFQKDADLVGLGGRMRRLLAPKLAREQYTRGMFDAEDFGDKLRLLLRSNDVKKSFRWRIFLYAVWPAIYQPVFLIKRLRRPAIVPAK